MQATLRVTAEQQELLDELKQQLLSGAVHHVRLLGEPGVGKTRFALEITRGDLAPVVLYFRDGMSFQARSDLIYELVQPDDRRFVVLVVDECGPKDRASIWNLLKSHAGKVRLITIDHGPDESAGDGVRIVRVPTTSKEQIAAIIRDYGVTPLDADRWAEFCEGCPRVAHVIGENLRHNRADLFQHPAHTEVWDRFIVGRDDPISEEVILRKIALMHIALFERFGFESPVHAEMDFIADMATRRDERLTRGRFRAIVQEMKRRRILQGTTTLYLTPRLLHVYLYRQFWEKFGGDLDIAALLQSMPTQLWRWFVEMLRYGDDSCPNAKKAIDQILGSSGLFPGSALPDTREHGRLLMALAEANRKAVLKYLQRTLVSEDGAICASLRECGQYLLWGLERIAVHGDCFIGGADLLLSLAEAETADRARGATEMFSSLFHPAWGQTEAPFERRLPVLQSALDSESPRRREVALSACKAAIATRGGFRVVGAEHQGIQKAVEFWRPTYAELWDAFGNIWQLLVEKLSLWEGEDRRKLLATLVDSAWSMLQVAPLAEEAVTTLETIAADPMTNVTSLLRLIKRQLRFKEGKLPHSIADRLRGISDRLDGHDFPSKLRRFVKFSTVDDQFDEEYKATNLIDRKLNECADEAIKNPELLRNELPWLIREDSSAAYAFAVKIAQRDADRRWLSECLRHHEQEGDRAGSSFLGGYLAGIHAQNVQEWERCMLQLADCETINARYSDFVIASGLSEAVVKKVIGLCRAGVQAVERLERWWFSPRLRELSEDTFASLVGVQIQTGRARLWASAVQMWHTYFVQDDGSRRLPEKMTFTLLADERVADESLLGSFGFYWSRVAAVFMQQYPRRKWDLFRKMLLIGIKQWRILGDLDMHQDRVFTTLVKEDPNGAWEQIAEAYQDSVGQSRFGLSHWLADGGPAVIGSDASGPVQWLPKEIVFSWVTEDVDDRAAWLASMLPKTLNGSPAGRLTRDFLTKFGRNKRAFDSLLARFRSSSWCGSASDHYRSLRDDARQWLVGENNTTVIQWVEEYIECLTFNIEREEIEEERRL